MPLRAIGLGALFLLLGSLYTADRTPNDGPNGDPGGANAESVFRPWRAQAENSAEHHAEDSAEPHAENAAEPHVEDSPAFAYRHLGDVPLADFGGRLLPSDRLMPSDSGDHVAVFAEDHLKAAYTDHVSGGLLVQELPVVGARWGGGDVLLARLPYTAESIALPPYPDVHRWKDEDLSGVSLFDRVKRVAVSAWWHALHGDGAAGVFPPASEWARAANPRGARGDGRLPYLAGPPAIATAEHMRAASREYFLEPAYWDHLSGNPFPAVQAAARTYFVNQHGGRVEPDTPPSIDTTELYVTLQGLSSGGQLRATRDGAAWRTGNGWVLRVTPEDGGRVERFSHDPATSRILVRMIPEAAFVFNPEHAVRHELPAADPGDGAALTYRLVPGEPYVIVMAAPSDSDAAPRVELWTDEGEYVTSLPMDTDHKTRIRDIHVGQNTVAVLLNEIHGDGEEARHRPLLRVFAAERAP